MIGKEKAFTGSDDDEVNLDLMNLFITVIV